MCSRTIVIGQDTLQAVTTGILSCHSQRCCTLLRRQAFAEPKMCLKKILLKEEEAGGRKKKKREIFFVLFCFLKQKEKKEWIRMSLYLCCQHCKHWTPFCFHTVFLFLVSLHTKQTMCIVSTWRYRCHQSAQCLWHAFLRRYTHQPVASQMPCHGQVKQDDTDIHASSPLWTCPVCEDGVGMGDCW